MIDHQHLLSPSREPPAVLVSAIDVLSWLLPVFAALLSVGAGVAALCGAEGCAAAFGITGGLFGAVGVLFTNWASRIRDHRLARAWSTGLLALDFADRADRRNSAQF